MNRKLILRPEAEAELAEAVGWYEARGKGLGADFMRAVDAAMATIKRNPEQYQTIKGQVRRAVLRRFPYGLTILLHHTTSPCLRVFTVGVIRKDGPSEHSRVRCHNREYVLS